MHRTQAVPRGDRAFTVVELVVASAVLLVVLTAAMTGIVSAAQSEQMSERRAEALSIANSQIELARNLPFDDVAAVVPANGMPAGKIPAIQTIGIYTATTDIAYGTYGASAAARYKTISVVVSWSSPVVGSVTLSSIIAGGSVTQDYNFGTVSLQIQDEGSPALGIAGVTVELKDANGRTYDVATAATGIARFEYVPSGNITFTATRAGYLIDTPASPTCVANTTTAYGPVTAHALRTGVVRCLSPAGTPVAGVLVALSGGPGIVSPVMTDADGYARFAGVLIKGTYAIGVVHASYQTSASDMLTVGATDVNALVTLVVKPSAVTATRSGSAGAVYVWNADHTPNTSVTTSNNRPYVVVFALANRDIAPAMYYFTKTNVFATTNPATVTPGLPISVTVN